MNPSTKFLVSASVFSVILGGCYVIPIEQDGKTAYLGPYLAPPPHVATSKPGPIALPARLYPNNDMAAATGVVSGSVTNMMTGKGRFTLNYKGESYAGEATRVSDDDKRGVASAFSSSGGYMSCEYQMNTPRQGAGTCVFSDGAQYKLHIGG